jgi:hypothetical protein
MRERVEGVVRGRLERRLRLGVRLRLGGLCAACVLYDRSEGEKFIDSRKRDFSWDI